MQSVDDAQPREIRRISVVRKPGGACTLSVDGADVGASLSTNDFGQVEMLARAVGLAIEANGASEGSDQALLGPRSESSSKSSGCRNQRKTQLDAETASDFLFTQSSPPTVGARTTGKPGQLVMGRYWMHMADEDVTGEGSSSICRRGEDTKTGRAVAVKYYKAVPDTSARQPRPQEDSRGHPEDGQARTFEELRDLCAEQYDALTVRTYWESSCLPQEDQAVAALKFRRQVAVLQRLQLPLQRPSDPSLWCSVLDTESTADLFLQLVDYSRDAAGEPAPSADDGQLYIVTELGEYSLLDYLWACWERGAELPKEVVRRLARDIVRVVAALHAKGLAHLDLKPENLMIFDGRLKLIDVDGCVPIGKSVSLFDSTLSCSPAYVAPEWAKFCITEAADPCLAVTPKLDVWSVGMIVCELVTLEPILARRYDEVARNSGSQSVRYHFYQWLSSQQEAPIPFQMIEDFDRDLAAFLSETLLVCDPARRWSLAQSLLHPYLAESGLAGDVSDSGTGVPAPALPRRLPASGPQRARESSQACCQHGLVWHLREHGDPLDPSQWLERDTWINDGGDLCYLSSQDSERLVLAHARHIAAAEITKLDGTAKVPALALRWELRGGSRQVIMACDSRTDYLAWLRALRHVKEDALKAMTLGHRPAPQLRRQQPRAAGDQPPVEPPAEGRRGAGPLPEPGACGGEPLLRAKLWRLRAEGDAMKETDWYERETWLTVGGSLAYWSRREAKPLVYYTSQDLGQAVLQVVPRAEACRPFVFSVHPAPRDGVHSRPGYFAAESGTMRARWLAELRRLLVHDPRGCTKRGSSGAGRAGGGGPTTPKAAVRRTVRIQQRQSWGC